MLMSGVNLWIMDRKQAHQGKYWNFPQGKASGETLLFSESIAAMYSWCCICRTLTLLVLMMEALRMCAGLTPNLLGTGVIPMGPISFNEALVVVFALPPSHRYQQVYLYLQSTVSLMQPSHWIQNQFCTLIWPSSYLGKVSKSKFKCLWLISAYIFII